MLPVIIGDVIGSRFEWNNKKSKNIKLFTKNSRPTDDSIMSLAIAKALIESKDDFYKNLSENTIKHMQQLGKMYPNCGFGGRFKKWINSENPTPYDSFGNGSAMRVSPVAYVASDIAQLKKLCHDVTVVTHNHPEGLKGAECTAICVWMALHGNTKTEIKDYVQKNYYNLDFSLNDIRPEYKFDVSCQGSVPIAIKAFLESVSFNDSIITAISMGGDSDTISAISASIAGAFYKIDSSIVAKTLSKLDSYQTSILNDFNNMFIKN